MELFSCNEWRFANCGRMSKWKIIELASSFLSAGHVMARRTENMRGKVASKLAWCVPEVGHVRE